MAEWVILDPVKTALPQILASSEATSYLSEVICQGSTLDLHCQDPQRQFAIHKKIDSFPEPRKRCLQRKLIFSAMDGSLLFQLQGIILT